MATSPKVATFGNFWTCSNLPFLSLRYTSATQDYDFNITYHKGSENSNADALSRQTEQGDSHTAAITMESLFLNELKDHQSQDPVLCKLHDALLHSSTPPTTWSQPPLNRYRQLWSQLLLKDGLVCQQTSSRFADSSYNLSILSVRFTQSIP